ncbi:single-stranded DNA-binding protein [Cellulomonas marina]|uniref:Single-stranded DNA-binding protein n=1 Tax=Cellulomonas marina TaxID=988821 RepID=A0A1I0V8H5_9CELL|nr:single-stranded DNA-binding protein [Cellulomonas marina]GIG29236.1 hypothetical protein Cma02nite_18360 [Cellulomonas marina]SFA72350.1 single-strand DNA-binding protein [Cellulomonas marina]
MSNQGTELALTGWLGADPRHVPAADGKPDYTSLRVATTRRWQDRDGAWREDPTQWFTVKLWRQAALNAAQSLRRGDPVTVRGRLVTEEWTAQDGTPRTEVVLLASTIGHDLTFGTSHFTRTVRAAGAGGEGRPVDVTALAELVDEPAVEGADAPAEPGGHDDGPVGGSGADGEQDAATLQREVLAGLRADLAAVGQG